MFLDVLAGWTAATWGTQRGTPIFGNTHVGISSIVGENCILGYILATPGLGNVPYSVGCGIW